MTKIVDIYLAQLHGTQCPSCGKGRLFVDGPRVEIHCDNRDCRLTSAEMYEAIEDTGYFLVDVRVCSVCGELMHEGAYCSGTYYCSKECIDNDPGYSWDQFLEDCEQFTYDVYWTMWE